jgi:hypothetical protein
MWAVGIERIEEEERGAAAELQYPRATVPAGTVHTREERRQERRFFLLISCLIRLIHLLSLYRENFLTYKQGLLDP